MRGPIARLILGSPQTIAGTTYGTIVVMAALTAGASGYEHEPWRLAVLVVVTGLIFWIAHVYAHGLGESIALGRRLDLGELEAIARRELSIPLAMVLPTIALVLGAVGIVRDATAVWLALAAGAATLALQGVRYARIERLGGLGTAVAVAVNLALGLAIVALKVAISH